MPLKTPDPAQPCHPHIQESQQHKEGQFWGKSTSSVWGDMAGEVTKVDCGAKFVSSHQDRPGWNCCPTSGGCSHAREEFFIKIISLFLLSNPPWGQGRPEQPIPGCGGGVGPSWSCIPVFGVSSGFIPRELELPEMPKGPEEALIALSKSRANLGAFLSSSGFKERCPHQGGDGRHEREQQTFD